MRLKNLRRSQVLDLYSNQKTMRDIKKSSKEEFDDSTLEPTWAHNWHWNESFCKVGKQTQLEAGFLDRFHEVSWIWQALLLRVEWQEDGFGMGTIEKEAWILTWPRKLQIDLE